MNLPPYWQTRMEWVNEALDRYLPTMEEAPARLHEAMRYSVFAGGKRLRPLLVLETAQLLGLDPRQALPTASAVECIHTYSLIHDDLPCLDDDDYRRGRPSCHRAFGEATALLAGDALLTLAFRLVAQNAEEKDVTPERVVRVVRELGEAAGSPGMVGGQVLDLEWANRPATLDVVQDIHRRKTMALIRASVRCGAILAGAMEGWAFHALSNYGQAIGLAFQIMDDVLDVIGDEKLLGKAVGRDESQNKATFPAVYGLEESQQRAQELVEMAQADLKPFGPEADCLRHLAAFIVARES